MNASDKFGPLRKGMLEYAVLTVIAAHHVYAADILQKLNATELATAEGSLYPLLSRLKREGLVAYEWQESEAGPPRKYYHLTSEGKQQLAALRAYWQKLDKTVQQLGEHHA